MIEIVNAFFEECKRELEVQTKDKEYGIFDLGLNDCVFKPESYIIKGLAVNPKIGVALGFAFIVTPKSFIRTIKEEAKLAVEDAVSQINMYFWEALYGV